MFSPAFRLALERTLSDDITPEALEGVFRVSMRKMTDAKKCRTGVNLSKNLLIAKIIHKTRNIIIAAKKDQESASSIVTNTLKPPSPPPCLPKVTTPEKIPLVETQPEPSPRVSSPLPTNLLNIRLKPQHDTELQTVDENVAPLSGTVSNRGCQGSPRPTKRPHSLCSDKSSEHSSWSGNPPTKIGRMEVDDSQDSDSVFNAPSITIAATSANTFTSVTSSSSGHLHFHNQMNQPHSSPANVATARWSFCSKDQSSTSPVTAVIYSPYHQRMSMPLTTCPI